MAASRDILLMFRQNDLSETEMKHEVQQLNHLLISAERPDNFVRVHEVFDINRYRIIREATRIKDLIRKKGINKPFIFFNNKN